jgi:beta-lactamase superfamily II metal-dependent hydrolase
MDGARGANSPPTYFTAAEFKANDARFECGSAKFDLLTVNATEVQYVRHDESKENAGSAVVKVFCAGRSIVLTGDLGAIR